MAEVEQGSHRPGVQHRRDADCASVCVKAYGSELKTLGNGGFEELRENLVKQV